MSTIRPLLNRIVVKPFEDATVQSSILEIPDSVKSSQSTSGRVIAVGPGKYDADGNLIPVSVAVDDVVLYAKGTGAPVSVDGDSYIMMYESDVVAVV